MPPDALSIVADFYCDNLRDAAHFSQVSRRWFAGVLYSGMWKERIEPLTSRNPFPVNERDHHNWHFDVEDPAQVSVLRGYIQSKRISGPALSRGGQAGKFTLWLKLPNWRCDATYINEASGEETKYVSHNFIISVMQDVWNDVVASGAEATYHFNVRYICHFANTPLDVFTWITIAKEREYKWTNPTQLLSLRNLFVGEEETVGDYTPIPTVEHL